MTPRWWESLPAMRRVARWSLIIAVTGFIVSIVTWSITLVVAVPAVVIGTAAIVSAMFSWFRAEHLRELDDLKRLS